jgi:hypothetical protein
MARVREAVKKNFLWIMTTSKSGNDERILLSRALQKTSRLSPLALYVGSLLTMHRKPSLLQHELGDELKQIRDLEHLPQRTPLL